MVRTAACAAAVLVVDIDGERADVLGDVRVWLGGSGTSQRRYSTRQIAVDDTIFVTGTLAVDPDLGWVVTKSPSSQDGFVNDTADSYEAPVVPLAFPLMTMWLVIFTGCWLLVLSRLGDAALERAVRDSTVHTEIASMDALAVAAAMPGASSTCSMSAFHAQIRVWATSPFTSDACDDSVVTLMHAGRRTAHVRALMAAEYLKPARSRSWI